MQAGKAGFPTLNIIDRTQILTVLKNFNKSGITTYSPRR
jgi:hypothetical protein